MVFKPRLRSAQMRVREESRKAHGGGNDNHRQHLDFEPCSDSTLRPLPIKRAANHVSSYLHLDRCHERSILTLCDRGWAVPRLKLMLVDLATHYSVPWPEAGAQFSGWLHGDTACCRLKTS